jgi:type II secretory pathway pseudopilin PulG
MMASWARKSATRLSLEDIMTTLRGSYGMGACQGPSSRPAFKLVELILVVAIITVVIMLVLPLLQRTSDHDMNRMQCWHNLGQLALASHNYHVAFGHYPPGTVAGSAEEPKKRFSNLTELLPFVEHDQVYKCLDLKQPWQAPANKDGVSKIIKVFLCPADPGLFEKTIHNQSNYVGIAGAGVDAASLPITDARCGIFGYDRTVRVKDVEDGTANTLLILEMRRKTGAWAAGGPATVRGIDPEDDPPIGQDCAFGMHVDASRWVIGRRKTGAMAAMADGSIRRLWDGTSAEVLAALATIAGGDNDGLRIDW